jgi:hypothetical protein
VVPFLLLEYGGSIGSLMTTTELAVNVPDGEGFGNLWVISRKRVYL